MEHKSSNSAILDVVIENKDISNILKDNDRSSLCSNSTLENSLVKSFKDSIKSGLQLLIIFRYNHLV